MGRSVKSSKPKAVKAKGSTGLKTKADVARAVFKVVCEDHAFGMAEWSRADLAAALGFKNPRTEKFAHGLKILLDDGDLQVGKAGMVVMSAKGIAKKPKDTQPKTLEEIHDRYIKQLEDKVKCGANRVRELWKILSDRKPHTIDELSRKLGYGNPRSFTNMGAIPLMEGAGLVIKKGKKVTMTDKAFPSNLNK